MAKKAKNEAGSKKIHVNIYFISPILGSLPAKKEILTEYIQSKAPVKTAEIEAEVEYLDATDDELKDRVTIFPKSKSGNVFFFDYVMKGFFKNACHAMREVVGSVSSDLSAYKTKIDNCIFIDQRYLVFKDNATNEMIPKEELTILQRPLRASTPLGPRTTLSASEMMKPEVHLSMDIDIRDANLYPYVIEWLEYGKVNGLGQWHNGGYGRFLFEEVLPDGTVVSSNASNRDELIKEYYEFEGFEEI